MKAKDVKNLRDDEIAIELAKLRTELFDMRSQSVSEKVEDTSKFGKVRKDIARLLTQQNARRTPAAAKSAAPAPAPKAAKTAKPSKPKVVKKKVATKA